MILPDNSSVQTSHQITSTSDQHHIFDARDFSSLSGRCNQCKLFGFIISRLDTSKIRMLYFIIDKVGFNQ